MDSKEKMKVELVDLARRFKRVHPTPPKEVRELSQVEMHALIGVARADEKGLFLRPSDIARMSHTSPSAVSQVLKSLEQRGFIERNRVEGNSRSVQVELTEKGRKVARSAYEARSEFLGQMIESVGESDMEQFVSTLRKICEYIESSDKFEALTECPHPLPFISGEAR